MWKKVKTLLVFVPTRHCKTQYFAILYFASMLSNWLNIEGWIYCFVCFCFHSFSKGLLFIFNLKQKQYINIYLWRKYGKIINLFFVSHILFVELKEGTSWRKERTFIEKISEKLYGKNYDSKKWFEILKSFYI